MKISPILIFGSSGQIGKSLIKFTKNNYKVIAVTRVYIEKVIRLKPKLIMAI